MVSEKENVLRSKGVHGPWGNVGIRHSELPVLITQIVVSVVKDQRYIMS